MFLFMYFCYNQCSCSFPCSYCSTTVICRVWSCMQVVHQIVLSSFSSSTCAHSFTLPVTGTASGNFNQTEYIVALPSGNLAVYNFSREQEGSYLCLIKRRTGLQQYKLYKLVAKNSESIVLVNIRTS